MTYWQIAAGSASRDYSADFLKYGIAFVGDEKQIATMTQVQVGDLVILKKGMTEIVAAGTVVDRNGKCKGNAVDSGEEDKHWLRDYDGWDLPAYCFVNWHQPPEPKTVQGLTQATIQQVRKPELRKIADEIIACSFPTPTCPEPTRVEPLNDDEMLEFLIEKGLRPSTADELTITLKRIRLLAKYYYWANEFAWDDVREHETRTFLIVPFLLALGWSEQQIKIELPVAGGNKRIDVACFCHTYRKRNDDCVLLLESKGFCQGLDYAHEQGKNYAAEFTNCRVVVASNGYCYKAYRRNANAEGFEEMPSAYLNLLRPTKQYPLNPSIGGGLKLLSYLLPHSCGDEQ
jgi:hypothetical protein